MPAQCTKRTKRTKRTIEQKFTIIKAYEEVSAQKGAKAAIVSRFQLPDISSLNTILTNSSSVQKYIARIFYAKITSFTFFNENK